MSDVIASVIWFLLPGTARPDDLKFLFRAENSEVETGKFLQIRKWFA